MRSTRSRLRTCVGTRRAAARDSTRSALFALTMNSKYRAPRPLTNVRLSSHSMKHEATLTSADAARRRPALRPRARRVEGPAHALDEGVARARRRRPVQVRAVQLRAAQ